MVRTQTTKNVATIVNIAVLCNGSKIDTSVDAVLINLGGDWGGVK